MLQVQVARVVFNTGQPADEQYYSFSPPAEVVNMENYFKRCVVLYFLLQYLSRRQSTVINGSVFFFFVPRLHLTML